MLIDDHSITYLNLQDKSGMKFDSKNNVSEIVNYRNKLFENKKTIIILIIVLLMK